MEDAEKAELLNTFLAWITTDKTIPQEFPAWEMREKERWKKGFPLDGEDGVGVRQTRHPQVHRPC